MAGLSPQGVTACTEARAKDLTLRKIARIALTVALASAVVGSGRAEAESLIGLTTTGRVVTFDSASPGTIISDVSITGLQSGETLLGIDRRPANGLLYGLGSTSRIYSINTTTGVASSAGATPFSPALSGTSFGFDFNPVPDRIRVVSTDTSNFRLNPNTGTLAGNGHAAQLCGGRLGRGPHAAGCRVGIHEQFQRNICDHALRH